MNKKREQRPAPKGSSKTVLPVQGGPGMNVGDAHKKATLGQTVEGNARQYILDVFGGALERNKARCAVMGGRYCFRLSGTGGGAWTLDFDRGVLTESADEGAQLLVEMNAGDFVKSFISGASFSDMMKSGAAKVRGEPVRMRILAALLNAYSRQLQAEAGG